MVRSTGPRYEPSGISANSRRRLALDAPCPPGLPKDAADSAAGRIAASAPGIARSSLLRALPSWPGSHGSCGEDLRSVGVRVGEVVHQARVFRAVVAAQAAVAAQGAGVLLDPGGVRAVRARHVEKGAAHLDVQVF